MAHTLGFIARTLAQRHCYTCLFHWAGALAARKVAEHTGNAAISESGAGRG